MTIDLSRSFAVIDFEASGLSLCEPPEFASYPIEVGVAIAGMDGSISTWSSLIRPHADWTRLGEWDRKSELKHGIARQAILDGKTLYEVAAELEFLLARFDFVWCSEKKYDRYWLYTLYHAIKRPCPIKLRELRIIRRVDPELGCRFSSELSLEEIPHRAGLDATLMCESLLRADYGLRIRQKLRQLRESTDGHYSCRVDL